MADNILINFRIDQKQKNIKKNRDLMLKVAADYIALDNQTYDFDHILIGINSDDKDLKHSCENLLIEKVFPNIFKDTDQEIPVINVIAETPGDNVSLMKLALHYNGFCGRGLDKLTLLQNACMANNLNIAKYIFSEYSIRILMLHSYDTGSLTKYMIKTCEKNGYNDVIKWYNETVIAQCNDHIKNKIWK